MRTTTGVVLLMVVLTLGNFNLIYFMQNTSNNTQTAFNLMLKAENEDEAHEISKANHQENMNLFLKFLLFNLILLIAGVTFIFSYKNKQPYTTLQKR